MTDLENKYYDALARIKKYGDIDFRSYEEQEELIKVLKDLCQIQTDRLIAIHNKYGIN
jgi:hypothetical protein